MKFSEVVQQAVQLLQTRGRVTYRVLKREFALDDEALEDLKEQLIEAEALAVDEDGKMLVWVGATSVASSPPPPAPQTPNPELRTSQSPLAYTPKHLADKILTSRAALEG